IAEHPHRHLSAFLFLLLRASLNSLATGLICGVSHHLCQSRGISKRTPVGFLLKRSINTIARMCERGPLMRLLLAIVIIAAAAWAGYWFIGSSALRSGITAWFDARESEGWVADYSKISVRGFPNRFDTNLTDVDLQDPVSGLGWQAPFFQVFSLSYKPYHVIAVWPHEQRILAPEGAYKLSSTDMRASLVLEASTKFAPKRSTLTAENLAWVPENGPGAISAAVLTLAGERAGDNPETGDPRYHLGLVAEEVAPP